jgi:hypothetical protein
MSTEQVSASDLTALAAHLHVQLRRRTGRVTDVEWMVSNSEYAHTIISLAKASAITEGAPELGVWATRFEMAVMKFKRPRQPLMSALAIAGASRPHSGPAQLERQSEHSLPSQFQDSQFNDGIVSEFGDSHRSVDTSQMPQRKPLNERYVWSLR